MSIGEFAKMTNYPFKYEMVGGTTARSSHFKVLYSTSTDAVAMAV